MQACIWWASHLTFEPTQWIITKTMACTYVWHHKYPILIIHWMFWPRLFGSNLGHDCPVSQIHTSSHVKILLVWFEIGPHRNSHSQKGQNMHRVLPRNPTRLRHGHCFDTYVRSTVTIGWPLPIDDKKFKQLYVAQVYFESQRIDRRDSATWWDQHRWI